MQAWDFFGWLQFVVEVFSEQIAGFITGVVGTALVGIIALIIKPSLVPRLAKLTFIFRKASRNLCIQSFFDFYLGDFDGDMDALEGLLKHSGYFEEVQCTTGGHEKRIDLVLSLDGKRKKYSLLQVLDEDGAFEAIRAVHDGEISYRDIGNYVDLTMSARDTIHRSLTQANLEPRNLPFITVEITWDNKSLSILPWLKQDYVFVGSIEIIDSDIRILQSDRGIAVGSSVATPEFKNILRSLVVGNLTN